MSLVERGIVLRQIDRLFGEGTLTGLGDGQLLERYLSRRDEDAFAALVDRLGPMVLGLCRRMLRDPRDIEDAFQATFLVLVRKAPSIRDRELLSSWLYGVAYRVARRARARTLRRRDREAAVGVPEVASQPATQPTEIDPMLDQELSRLPERYRAPLVLCYLRGRTHEQAAEALRCPVGTVRSRLARGRDLLRRRLTRRGFAPSAMAGLLGGDLASMVRLLIADVPPPMAAAIVRAAVGCGSSSLIKAGAAAASSVALARGVLTSMKLAQLKWIGPATIATCLSAGGVVAVGAASAPRQEAAPARQTAVVPPAKVNKELEAPPPVSPTEARLQALEEKMDRLLSRQPLAANGSDTRFAAVQGETRDSPQLTQPGEVRPTPTNPISELEIRLNLAIREYLYTQNLRGRNVVSQNEVEMAHGKVRLIAAQVEALDEKTQDELDRLQLERRRKVAQLEKGRAEMEIAAALVKRNEVLNRRKPEMVAAEEVARADGQLKVATAQRDIAEVEVAEVDLRMQQLSRRRDRIKRVIEVARPVK